MALVPYLLLLSTNLIFLATVEAQTNPNTIALGSSLSPNTPPWLSPSGIFAFGFIAASNDTFTVGVFILDQQETTVVWTANRNDPPVPSNSVLELTTQGQLVLRTTADRGEKLVASPTRRASSASLLDSGNFVLYDNESRVIWESFASPTDTILVGQNLTSGKGLISSKSNWDRSEGRFWLISQADGNLVLYPVNSSYITEDSYWASGFTGSAPNLYINSSGFLNFFGDPDSRNGPSQRILANGTERNRSNSAETRIYRATLDPDGVFRLYSHLFLGNESSRIVVEWSALENRCDVKGFCGFNSFCSNNGAEGATCHCFPGFDFIDPVSRSLGCYQNFSRENCREDSESGLMRYNISSALENVSWINYPYTVLPLRKELCRKSCLDDCNCWAISYTPEKCKKYKLPLRYGKRIDQSGTTAFFKAVLGSVDTLNNTPPGQVNPEITINGKNAPVLILTSSLGSITLLCFALAVSSVVIYKRQARKYKKLSDSNPGLAEYFALQSFSYEELERATNGFREELGKGCFGTVYRGNLPGKGKAVAVKRLEKVAEEGIREFRAEMTTIGRTHHRNLVQLIGFCTEGSKKLLVYEYMSNGSLADLLFNSSLRPGWRERVRFVLDVARGLLYLHEECGVHIIHCNLKPQNVLLDETWTAKISDFGLARLLITPNQGKVSEGIDGNLSYAAPEWKKSALISVKADIYSFGIVLLETVCCRRNIEVKISAPDEIILSDWVYRCFFARELNRLVEDLEGDYNEKVLERIVKVGLWCIQDDPAARPLMKSVILMLEGTMDIPIPPSPHHSLI